MTRKRRFLPYAVIAGIVGLLFMFLFASRAQPYRPVGLISHGGFAVGGEYPSAAAGNVSGPRYGSWRGSDAHTGLLISEPFVTQSGLAITIAGYPSHPLETIELERIDDPRQRIRLETIVDPGDRWEPRVLNIPRPWRNVDVRLIATDAGKGWGDWLGIADVRNPYFSEVFSNDSRIHMLAFGALTMTLVFPCLFAGSVLCARLCLPEFFLFSLVLVILGVAAEAVFFLTICSGPVAVTSLWIATVAGGWTTIRALSDVPFRRRLACRDVWAPFAATALCGIGYLALICVADPSTGSIVGFVMKWLGLPVDNELPHALAAHVWMHASPKPFVGDWLSSDRPPLQAGFDLLYGALVPLGHDEDARYQALSVLLQASAFGALITLCRSVGVSHLRAAGIVLLAWLASFFFVNSIFVWPKLLAAAFVAVSIAIFFAPGRLSAGRAAVIGLACALGLLSHGGVVFTVPVLALAWIFTHRQRAIRPILIAGALLVVTTAPWTWYQKVYDPPGDRLLKWHLAGQIPVSSESFVSALVKAYRDVPPSTIVANKIGNFALVLGTSMPSLWPSASPATVRSDQFFSVRYALSALVAPYLAALFFFNSRRPMLRIASRFAWIALGANVFWCLAMYLPFSTTVHQGSYLTIMLMFFAAGCVATEWLSVFLLVLAVQSYIFVTAWLPKFDFANVFTPIGIVALFVLISVGVVSFVLIAKPIIAAIYPSSKPASNRETIAT